MGRLADLGMGLGQHLQDFPQCLKLCIEKFLLPTPGNSTSPRPCLGCRHPVPFILFSRLTDVNYTVKIHPDQPNIPFIRRGSLYVERLQNPVEANINFVDRETPNTNQEFNSNFDKPKPAVDI